MSFNEAKEIELKWCKGKQFQFSNGTLSCFLGIWSRGSFSSTMDMDWSLNHSLQRNRPLKRELNQTHLQQLSQIPNPSQTHLSHLIEALNQLAKREVPSFMRDKRRLTLCYSWLIIWKSTPIWPLGIVQPTHWRQLKS